MRRSTAAIFAAATLFLGVGYLATGRADASGPRAIMGPAVGDLVLDVQFRDVEKGRGRLSDLREAGAAVLVTWDVECAAAQQHLSLMQRLEAALAERGIEVVYLNLRVPGSIKEMKEDVAEQGLRGRYVRDPEWKAARLVQPRTIPEAFVIDAAGTLRYRGAVSGSQAYLQDAVDAVLAGLPVEVAETEAVGCDVVAPGNAAPPLIPVTYHNRISRTVQGNCQSCHGGEGVAAPLDTRAALEALAPAIRGAITGPADSPSFTHPAGAIPPGTGPSARHVAELRDWIDAGMPEGRRRDSPRPR